jgi:hypothetical protein
LHLVAGEAISEVEDADRQAFRRDPSRPRGDQEKKREACSEAVPQSAALVDDPQEVPVVDPLTKTLSMTHRRPTERRAGSAATAPAGSPFFAGWACRDQAPGYTLRMDDWRLDPGLPGAELVRQGLADLARGAESIPALLVAIGAARLRRCGLSLPEPLPASPERRLYDHLASSDSDSAHSRYNALLRRLVSYERALECVSR